MFFVVDGPAMYMSLAAKTRDAVRARPFVYEALRLGVVNYAAAARVLDVSEDYDAVATALRRYGSELSSVDYEAYEPRITMQSGLEASPADPVLQVGDQAYGIGGGEHTGIQVTGEVPVRGFGYVLMLLAVNDIEVVAAGVGPGQMVVVVGRRDGSAALRLVEQGFASVPV